MIVISPRCHARSAIMPWASSRPPPGNSQSANDIVDTLCCPGINIIKKKKKDIVDEGPEKCQICPTLLVKVKVSNASM